MNELFHFAMIAVTFVGIGWYIKAILP